MCFKLVQVQKAISYHRLHHFINKELFAIEGVEQAQTYYIKEIKKRYQELFGKNPEDVKPYNLKPIDYKLIKALVKDGRENVSDLAKKLGTHVSTVSRRISALLKEEIIKICAVPNPAKLGYLSNATMILEVKTERVAYI